MEPSSVSPRAPGSLVSRSVEVAVLLIAVVAAGFALALGRPILVPVVAAWLARSAFAPYLRRLARIGVPQPLSAALLILGIGLVLGFLATRLSEPAAAWAERLPRDIRVLQQRLESGTRDLKKPLKDIEAAGKAVSDLKEQALPEERSLQVELVKPGTTASIVSGLWRATIDVALVLILLYFMLAKGDSLLAKIVANSRQLGDAKRVVAAFREIESRISTYLTTVTLINLALGLVVAAICWACSLPNPLLWGALAAVFNFVPYVGALLGVALVALVGLTTHPTLSMGLLPAALYLTCNVLEGALLTPYVLGRTLRLTPVAVWVWLFVLSWLWGVPGALLAVPTLVSVRILCENRPGFQGFGRILGDSDTSC